MLGFDTATSWYLVNELNLHIVKYILKIFNSHEFVPPNVIITLEIVTLGNTVDK